MQRCADLRIVCTTKSCLSRKSAPHKIGGELRPHKIAIFWADSHFAALMGNDQVTNWQQANFFDPKTPRCTRSNKKSCKLQFLAAATQNYMKTQPKRLIFLSSIAGQFTLQKRKNTPGSYSNWATGLKILEIYITPTKPPASSKAEYMSMGKAE